MTLAVNIRSHQKHGVGLLLLLCSLLSLGFGCNPGRLVAASEDRCANYGEVCTSNPDCCSENCIHGSCGLRVGCRSAGESCTSHSECCYPACDATGLCAKGGECQVTGTTCDRNSDCCSGACVDTGANFVGTGISKLCQAVDGCKPMGELCTKDSNTECCSGNCKPQDPNATPLVYTCPGVLGCESGGEVCNPGGAAPTTIGCCPPPGGVGPLCATDRSGVPRCRASSNPAGQCAPPGTHCSSAMECCGPSNQCLPDSTGNTFCTAACSHEGEPCRAPSDCCNGADLAPLTCDIQNSVCKRTGLFCRELGSPCSVSSDCCSGTCTAQRSALGPGGPGGPSGPTGPSSIVTLPSFCTVSAIVP